jgi:hypothetical protein
MIKKVKTSRKKYKCNHNPHHTQQEKTKKNKKKQKNHFNMGP